MSLPIFFHGFFSLILAGKSWIQPFSTRTKFPKERGRGWRVIWHHGRKILVALWQLARASGHSLLTVTPVQIVSQLFKYMLCLPTIKPSHSDSPQRPIHRKEPPANDSQRLIPTGPQWPPRIDSSTISGTGRPTHNDSTATNPQQQRPIYSDPW